MKSKRYTPLMLLALLGLMATTTQAQILHTESFDAFQFPPAGWKRTVATGTNFTLNWSRQTAGTAPNCMPHSGVGMARFNSQTAQVPDGSMSNLVTPAIDYSQITSNDTAWVSFWIYRDDSVLFLNVADSITVLVNTASTDTGGTRIGGVARSTHINLPDTVPTSGWYFYKFYVPSTFNTATNYIIFRGTAHHGDRIFIDDVSWVSYPVVCSGMPTAGTLNVNPATICGGSGISHLQLNGSTIVPGVSYQWQTSANANGPWTNVGLNDTLMADTLTVSAYVRAIATCIFSGMSDTTAATQITVSTQPLPSIFVSPTTIGYCVNSSPVLLQATGGVFYTWTPSTTLSASTGDQVYASPPAGGFGGGAVTYTVTGTDSTGCSNTATATVQPHAAPNITGITATPTSVCSGGAVTLTVQAGFGGGNTYVWSPGGMTTNNATANPTQNTTYTVTVTNTNNCTAETTVAVSVTPGVHSDFSYTANGLTVVFHDLTIGATSWHWFFGDGNESTAQYPTYTYSNPGTYLVKLVTTSATCGGDTMNTIISVYPNGIGSVTNDNSISLSPNPATSSVHIGFDARDEVSQLSLLNALGQKVMVKTLTSQTKMDEILSLNGLPKGIYTVEIVSGSEHHVRKLVVQ